MRALPIALTVLLAGATLVGVGVGVGTSAAAAAATAPPATCTDPEARDPVLLVHGWNSSASTWNGAVGTAAKPGPFGGSTPLAVSRFVYGDDSSDDKNLSVDWVTDPGIGHDLAATISCLATKSAQHGGIGKVFLVAHSMGGLAIRCALDPKCNDGGDESVAGVRNDVAEVITFGTPNQGSFLRVNSGGSAAESAVGDAFGAVCATLAAGARLPSVIPGCDYINAMASGSASVAFTPGSKELAALPAFNPRGATPVIPVREDAGKVSVTTSLGTLWHHTLDGDAGDLVVGTASATAQATPGNSRIQDCGSLDLSASAAIIGGLVGAALAYKDFGAGLACSHVTETSDGGFLADALATIDKWRSAHDPTQTTLLRTSGQPHASKPVAVPGGDEGATWNNTGQIEFWRWTSSTLAWKKVGTSRYPVLPAPDNDYNGATVTGALLTGMSDATFIATGVFTGDGTGNAVAFTNGSHGWGTIAPGSGVTLVPTGNSSTDNSTPGLRWGITFGGGELRTQDQNPFFAVAEGNEYPLVTYWKWTGAGFADDRDNAFSAAASSGPSSAPNMPASGCPQTGTYRASFGYVPITIANDAKTLKIDVLGPGATSYTDGLVCSYSIGADAAITVRAAYNSNISPGASGTLSGYKWLTAPAWFFANDISLGLENTPEPLDLYPGSVDKGSSPYVVGSALHVNTITSDFGVPLNNQLRQAIGDTPRPTAGIVTVNGTSLTGVVITQ
jgi:hypothetical protein